MAATIADFRTRFPEYSDDTEYSDARVQLFLDDAADCHIGTDENRWGGKYDKAQAYLAAHLLTIATNTEVGNAAANVGPVSSKSAGGVSVTKSVVAKDRSEGDDFYSSTSYGQQFLVLRNMCFAGVLVGC